MDFYYKIFKAWKLSGQMGGKVTDSSAPFLGHECDFKEKANPMLCTVLGAQSLFCLSPTLNMALFRLFSPKSLHPTKQNWCLASRADFTGITRQLHDLGSHSMPGTTPAVIVPIAAMQSDAAVVITLAPPWLPPLSYATV